MAAQIAEVEVNRKTGQVWAKRVVCAHDCGLIVNPEGLRRVVEGNLLYGLSRALYEEVAFDTEKVLSVDWITHPTLRHADAPAQVDVVLIKVGQLARLELDSFRDRKFAGEVTEIANTAKASGAGTQQEATKFEVKVRVKERELFRPGMSVTAEVETRYRTNVLCVPIQSVTTRLPSSADLDRKGKAAKPDARDNSGNGKKKDEPPKPVEVIFQRAGDAVKQVPVKRGISDDSFVEIFEGVSEGMEVVSGGFKAINRELEDGKPVKVDNEKKPPGEVK